jgi:hypothetical protein
VRQSVHRPEASLKRNLTRAFSERFES